MNILCIILLIEHRS